jgi:hypothetical protein
LCRVLHSFGDMTFTGLLIPVRKNDIKRRFSNAITKTGSFTKTGSGQLRGKLKTKRVCVFAAYLGVPAARTELSGRLRTRGAPPHPNNRYRSDLCFPMLLPPSLPRQAQDKQRIVI